MAAGRFFVALLRGLLLHLIHQLGHQCQLLGIEPLELLGDLGQSGGIVGLQIEELLRRDLEVVTDVEEGRHGGEIVVVLDVANVVFTLSDVSAHLTGGNVLLQTKFG